MSIPATRNREFAGPLSPSVASGASLLYRAVIQDEDGAPVAAGILTSLTLTIVNSVNGVVNGVFEKNILNTDRGTIDANGNLTIVLLGADTTLQAGLAKETRSLVIKWTWGTGRSGGQEVFFKVEALSAPENPAP